MDRHHGVTVPGCNTVERLGKDMNGAGEAIEKSAR
jgi:predicted small secreted protein